MKHTYIKFAKYFLAGITTLFVMSGCTATSGPGATQVKQYKQGFRVDNNDKVKVVVTHKEGIDIKEEGKKRLAQIIKKDIDELKQKNTNSGRSNQYLIKVHITKYDKGNAFARFVIAGAGQIHVDGIISVIELPSKKEVEEFNINKTFAWGGVYGGVTTIKEVGEGFAEGVAETVTGQEK